MEGIKKVAFPKDLQKKEKKEKIFLKENRDIHTKRGVIKKEQLNKESGIVKTHLGKEFILLPANFKDNFEKIERTAQIIIPKDFGVIIAETGLNKNSVIVEAGTGSGGLACLFAHIVKEVYSYDISEKAVKLGEKNAKFLDLKNVHFSLCNLKEKSPRKDADAVIIDMPGAEKTLDSVYNTLKSGGWLIGYFPQITQAKDFILNFGNKFYLEKISETIEREWVVSEKQARPKFLIQGHTAFLVFARKI